MISDTEDEGLSRSTAGVGTVALAAKSPEKAIHCAYNYEWFAKLAKT